MVPEGNPKLSAEARRRLSNPDARLLLPAIALAEACWAVDKGRSRASLPELHHAITTDTRFAVVPLDSEIVFAASRLPGVLEMHDRLIAATAARERAINPSVVLLTADIVLRNAGVVSTVW